MRSEAPSHHPLSAAPEVSPGQLDPREMLLMERGHCLREQAPPGAIPAIVALRARRRMEGIWSCFCKHIGLEGCRRMRVRTGEVLPTTLYRAGSPLFQHQPLRRP